MSGQATALPHGGVLHVIERCLGGVAAYVAATLKRQRQDGRRGPARLAADPALLQPGLAEAADALLPYRSGRRPAAALAAAWRVRRIVQETRPDIVHLHSSYPGLYGRLFASRQADAPAILYCAHGWSFEMETSPAKRTAYRLLERRLAGRADVIHSISTSEREAALAAGLPAAGHVAIPHGLGPTTPGPRPAALSADRLNLVFAGRIGAQKGLDLLLAALAQVRRHDITLHILGKPDGPEAAGYDYGDARVRRHGWIEPAAVGAWLAAADAVIVPSRWEGFGLIALEAMRVGAPVLAGRRGALPEILDDGHAGLLFDPEDTAALARLLDGLDREALARLGAAGKARWQAEYTAERADAALEAAYDLALERRRARG